MKLFIPEVLFDIPKIQLKKLNKTEIEKRLNLLNQLGSGEFVIIDYYRKKIIGGSDYSVVLGGYSKDFIDKNGLNAYELILKNDEWVWVEQLNKAFYEVFYQHSESERLKLVLSYDLTLIIDNSKIVFNHRLSPYQLCNNGNMWMALCHVVVSSLDKVKGRSSIVNKRTGEVYNYINKKFVLSDHKTLDELEIKILRRLIKGLSDKEMCLECDGLTLSSFKAKKRQLFQKLDADTAASAIHRAHLLGII